MKFRILIFLFFIVAGVNAQIAAVAVDEGEKSSNVTDIVVVFKMHVDVGYTDWAEGVLQKYTEEMLDKTLASIDETAQLPKSEQFVWTLPGWPLEYMLENSIGERKVRLEKAVKEQRIVPHALPFTFETEASDLENMVRGLTFAAEINSKYNRPAPRGAKLTDVPSHSRVLPTLLKNAGIDFLHLGCNPGSASPDVPTLFWWQGPDGSRLLTFYWAKYYGSGILPPKNWPYKTWLAMIHTHENSGAPTPAQVAGLLKTAKEKMPGVNIKIGQLSDFYDLLIKENPELPVITGDMPDTWIHGYMSMPRELKASKHLQRETYNCEILNTLTNQWWEENNAVATHINNAAENMLLFDEHTFGAAMTHGDQQNWKYNEDFKIQKSLGNYDYLEGTWREKGNRIWNAEKIIHPLLKRQMKNLAASVAVDGKRVVVYNPLPWQRSGRVEFFEGVYKKDFTIYGLKDAETGIVIPVYEDYNLLSFDAEAVPALGYKTYIPVLKPVDFNTQLVLNEKNNQLENRFFRIKINTKTGALSSVFDIQNKKELVNSESEYGFGEYFYRQAGQETIDAYNKNYVKPGAESWANDEMIRTSVPDKKDKTYRGVVEKIVYANLGNAVRATVFGRLNNTDRQQYLVTYTLYENQPYIEINWGVDGKKPNSIPEAGWLSFPFAVEKPEYRLNRTGGIVDPQRELIDRTNHDFYFLNTSMALFDKSGRGVVLNCPDAPGVSIDSPGLFKFSKTKTLTTGNVVVNLYNTQWGTNFTEWIEGSFSSKFYVWSFNKYNVEKQFITPSEETRVPLKGAFFEGEKGTQPVMQQGIELSRKGVVVTAFGENSYGEGTVLRLWEKAGESGECKIVLPEGSRFKTAFACNLRSKITDKKGIEIKNGKFSCFVGGNSPVSFILK
jgi:hypothetical protein